MPGLIAGAVRWLAIATLLFPFLLAQAQEAPSSVLQVRFIDSATGYAINPEYISAQRHPGPGEARLETSHRAHHGRASFALERGRHTITVRSPNHQPMSGDFEAGDDNLHRVEFVLDPIEKPRELESDHIEARHRDGAMLLQGFILDEELREPLAGVRVTSWPGGIETESDARGFFQFHVPVPADAEQSTSVSFAKQGYQGQTRHNLEVWSRGDCTYRIRLERGSGLETVDERDLRRRDGGVGEGEETSNLQPSTSNIQPPTSNLDQVELASTLAENATVRVPRNIRVERTKAGVTVIHYISMESYVKQVLPNEWIASWNYQSLYAGAVAVRSYAIARLNGRGPSSNIDICGDSNCQVFNLDSNHSRTDNAVAFTEGYVMINNSGSIASTEYSAENNSLDRPCGDGFTAPSGGCLYDPICIGQARNGHGRGLCQRGSNRWANGARGFPQRDWIWILEHYYPNLRLMKGAPLVVGDDVRSRSSDCHVRACPGGGIENGISCTLITTKASGQTGVIIGEPVRVMADGKGFTWYPIQWNDAGSTTGWSCENYIERVFPIPTAPADLTAAAVSTDRINLSWTDTSDVESGFEIQRAPGASGPWLDIGRVAANVTSFSDRNLLPASTWHYRVRARNAGGATGFTAVATATTPGAVAPTLAAIPDRTIAQGALFTFTAAATAPDRVQLITDFESFMSETANGVVLFQTPTNSSTTRNFINSAGNVGTNNVAAVTDTYPISGHTPGQVLRVTCQFTNASNPWLRLTTEGAATLPTPVIDFTKKLRFNIRADRDIRIGLGCRETATPAGATIGSSGGTSGAIEWVGVNNVVGGAPVPIRTVTSNSWTTVTFDFASEPVRSFSGGNGILSTASGLGVLEHLAIVPAGGMGVYNINLDNFAVVGSPKFTYTLGSGAPPGAGIHPVTGVFTWTPSQDQSPATNTISVIVTDDSLPPLSATNSFVVVVRESVPNSAPLLAPIADRMINAGAMVSVTAVAYDPNPDDILTFSLVSGAPSGAVIHPATGVFTWTPGDAHANTVQSITIRVTDDGEPLLSGTTTFNVNVLPRNNPPIMAPISNRSVYVGGTILFTNAAFDPNPGDVLTFSLDPGAPADASIHPGSGLFIWTPTEAVANTVNAITVRVTDNGYPPLSGTATFNVTVGSDPVIETVSISGNTVTLSWSALPGVTYRVEYKNNLAEADWTPLGPNVTPSGSVGIASDETFGSIPQRFYRVLVVND